ncbi:MAG: hypothetical protein K1X88_02985 [Nannocystaceae bacterium]|nr:hypothetical protein [Nannocystaceae bacterium]
MPRTRVVLSLASSSLLSCGSPTPIAGTGEGSGESGWDAQTSTGTTAADPADPQGTGTGGGGGSDSGEPPPASCDQVDPPDLAGVDADGDGVDGTVCASLFVDPTLWVPGNDGTVPSKPLATISDAIARASEYSPPRAVLVAAGDYAETLDLRGGVSIYGSYTAGFAARDLETPTRVTGVLPWAVVGRNLSDDVWLQALELVGPDATEPGASATAVLLVDNPAVRVTLEGLRIVAGAGGEGEVGFDAPPAVAGLPGLHGIQGGEGGFANCSGHGGDGAVGLVCPPVPPADGDDVLAALGGAGGAVPPGDCMGSVCGEHSIEGGDGSRGGDGTLGDGGIAALAPGELGEDGSWVAWSPTTATAGLPGAGGGGGGPASYDVDGASCGGVPQVTNGGMGGGGGAGGCGGAGGQPGGAGGASIAVVAVDSGLVLRSTTIVRGRGGDGGRGGNGGMGGFGGAGGLGSIGEGVMGVQAGRGGDGGGGGGGGGGAGGCGGMSIAIARRGAGSYVATTLAVESGEAGTPGAGGQGGVSPSWPVMHAPDGEPGCEAAVVELLEP